MGSKKDEMNNINHPKYDNVEFGDSKSDLVKNDSQADYDDVAPKKSFSQMWKEYPKSVFCIVGNEFCERFSYYGMRAILVLYLVNILKFETNTASALYHAFIVLCYFSPILGSILADGYIGKYHTIMWVSLLYASGNIILAVAATFGIGNSVHPGLDFFGLIVIALGTGGIKPCVSAFGGDQFKKGQEKQLETFFSVFYFSINAGSFISTLVTPILRVKPCLGEDTCYSLAFGVPAVLMVTAVILFAIGTPLYKRTKAKGNVLAEVCRVIGRALRNKRTFTIKRDYWLDHYLDDHSCSMDEKCKELGKCQKELFLKDVRAVLRVFVMYVPLPFFWMLYDQQGDWWTLQACTMNGITGGVRILPDQMGAINTIFIMAFIPLFDGIIYPLFGKCFKVTYLRKMCAGGFLAVIAFVVCAGLQAKVNKTLPFVPAKGNAQVSIMNYASCNLTVTDSQLNEYTIGTVDTNAMIQTSPPGFSNISVSGTQSLTLNVDSEQGCPSPTVSTKFDISITSQNATYVAISDVTYSWLNAELVKSTQGEGQFKVGLLFLPLKPYPTNVTQIKFAWCTENRQNITDSAAGVCINKNADDYSEVLVGWPDGSGDFTELVPVSSGYAWYLYIQPPGNDIIFNTGITFAQTQQGGIYVMTVVQQNNKTHPFAGMVVEVAQPNTVSIWWQLPQYIIITAAEILFSITGLVFSFTQAPPSMKSVIMAAWLVTDAVGNLFIIAIDLITIANQVYLYLLYAIIMFIVMVIFVLMSVFYYEYVDFAFA